MKNILCFGDSLTAGYYNGGTNFHPYANTLSNLLDDNFNIDHIGLSGATIDDMLEDIDNERSIDCTDKIWKGLRIQLKEKKYEYCIILAGTNDIEEEYSNYITTQLIKLHSIVHKLGCKTIALTIPKIKFENADANITQVREEVNDYIKTNVKSYTDNKYSVIDIATILGKMNPDDIYDYDGLHFKPDGYDEVAKIIAKFFIKTK